MDATEIEERMKKEKLNVRRLSDGRPDTTSDCTDKGGTKAPPWGEEADDTRASDSEEDPNICIK
jgi:hypothetical protein